MINSKQRAHANLMMLALVANKLGHLTKDLVFLGGAATALLITDTAVPDIRATLDVDCIVDVLSLNAYHTLEEQLAAQGFKKSMEDEVICRWHCDELILDVMPTDEKILGFGNRWYKSAVKNIIPHQLTNDLTVHSVTAPYFIATKLEAFKTRGNNDYLMSHDFEDIIAIIDGRIELNEELKSCDIELKEYLKNNFQSLLQNDNFAAYLPGYLNYGPATQQRANIVLDRIQQYVDILDE
jgi:predicted nucleotidyltransferase